MKSSGGWECKGMFVCGLSGRWEFKGMFVCVWSVSSEWRGMFWYERSSVVVGSVRVCL